MQSNASEMEGIRRERIAVISAEEEKQREVEERQRSDKGRFVSQLHQRAQEDSLDERIRRGRGGYAKIEAD
jgi:hypothetical protein